MELLILGMIIFMMVHLTPSFVGLRRRLIQWRGETVYMIGYSCAAMTGLVLIILGKGRAGYIPVWDPPDWGYPLTQVAMLLALTLLTAAYLPTNLKRIMRHPFLTGVALWALSHLLVNGDLASIILFAGFGAFAIFDMGSANRRGATISARKLPIYRDLILIAVGLALYGVIIHVHPYLFGVSAIP
jgi:uncharacterized membrane protein